MKTRRHIPLLLLLLMMASPDLHAQSDRPETSPGYVPGTRSQRIDWGGSWSRGYCRAVVEHRDLVIFGTGAGLRIMKTDNGLDSEEVGHFHMTDWIIDLDVKLNHVYAALRNGDLVVIDINNPRDPVLKAKLTVGYHWYKPHISIGGDLLYWVSGLGLQIVDISDPSDPHKVGHYDCFGRFVDNACRIVYVSTLDELLVIDAADPGHPVLVESHAASSGAGVFVADDLLLFDSGEDGIALLDIATPAHPEPISTIERSAVYSGAYAFAMEGSLVACATHQGCYFIDCSDRTDPVVLNRIFNSNYILNSLVMIDDYVYLPAPNKGLEYVDVSDPANPTNLGYWRSDGEMVDVKTEGDRAYALAYYRGFHILDLSNPADPVEMAYQVVEANHPARIAVRNNIVCVACRSEGIKIYDCSNPAEIWEIAALPEVFAWDIEIHQSYLLVGTGDSGLVVFDMSDPQIPVEVAIIGHPYGGRLSYFTLFGDLAYFVHLNTVSIIDVSDPSVPVGRSCITVPDLWGGALATNGEYAYVSTNYIGTWALDVSNPDAPYILSFHEDMKSNPLAVRADRYYASAHGTLYHYDISDPASPQLDSKFGYTVGHVANPNAITFWGKDLVVAGDCSGVWILHERKPIPIDRPWLDDRTQQNSADDVPVGYVSIDPNPFNPTTTVSFELQAVSTVRIKIFDLRGRLGRNLADRSFGLGLQALTWDGRNDGGSNMPSGTYFARLEAQSWNQTLKMQLVR